jgi:hypothetical protein
MVRFTKANKVDWLQPMIKGARTDICTKASADRRPSNLELIHVTRPS